MNQYGMNPVKKQNADYGSPANPTSVFNDYDICTDEGLSRDAFEDMIRKKLQTIETFIGIGQSQIRDNFENR